jgi:hypothetical protein
MAKNCAFPGRRAEVIVLINGPVDSDAAFQSTRLIVILGHLSVQRVKCCLPTYFKEHRMRALLRQIAMVAVLMTCAAASARAETGSYSPGELVDAGHRFFGGVSRGLATVIEKAVSQWGLPNGYVLGQEGGGAFVGGLRFGEGTLFTKNAGDLKVYWQGPSVGWDFGGDGARTMMLVYNLPATEAIYERFAGVEGSAYFIGGFGMTALTANNVVVVPIRSGLGFRLGANVGYLKFTPQATWNPF